MLEQWGCSDFLKSQQQPQLYFGSPRPQPSYQAAPTKCSYNNATHIHKVHDSLKQGEKGMCLQDISVYTTIAILSEKRKGMHSSGL